MRETTPRPRELRRASTEAERIAWRLLRSLQRDGLKFRRQHPIGPWVADFCVPGP
jgi:very-short-patch-repair endonuclease